MPYRFCATCATTRFVLSPSVATTTASASSIPASRSTPVVHPVTDDEAAAPVDPEPGERLFLLVDRDHVPALAVELLGDGGADPAAADHDHLHESSVPQRSGLVSVLLENVLRERDDEHLARGAAEHVLHRGREEARLPAPARSRAEDDQVDVALPWPPRRLPPRSTRARTVSPTTSTPLLLAERTGLLDRLGRPFLVLLER